MTHVDIVIIGGGVTGAGCLLEALSRGLRCVLLEKGDFSSGTTSASSRLIHGGIRYLEHLHFGLVAESLKERFWIWQHFPHLLRPIAIHIPVYGWGKRSPLVAGLGVKLHDLLAGKAKIEKSSIYLGKKARNVVREISHDGLSGLFVFHDYQILMPERIALESIDAAVSMGGRAENYTRVEKISQTDGGYLVEARNSHTGENALFSAAAVINAAGAWIDEVRKMAGFRGKLLRPTKGIHLEAEKLTGRALFVEAETDRRLFFILPFLNHTLVGTTDTDHPGSPDDVRPLPGDVDYLISNVNRIFGGVKLGPSRIFSAYAGLRPLINVPGKSESAVPRRHLVVCEGPGGRFVSITGGKLTTYRKMAEDTVKKAQAVLGNPGGKREGPPFLPCGITDPREREEFIRHLTGEHGIGEETASALYTVYGTRADVLLAFAGGDARLKSPLSPETAEIPAQILYAYEKESAKCLEDVLLRRMLIGKTPKKGLGEEGKIKEVLTRYMGKSPGEADGLFSSFRDSAAAKFMIKI